MMDTESDFVRRARQGEKEAFSAILRLHQARVRAFLSRYVQDDDLVDDLAQETFLTAYRSLDTYRGDSALSTWLLGIARHRVLQHLRDLDVRHAHRGGVLQAALARFLVGRAEGADACADHDREVSALRNCLKRLPPTSAKLVDEFYYRSRTAVDIARAAGKKEGAVWVALLRIRQALRQCMSLKLNAQEAT